MPWIFAKYSPGFSMDLTSWETTIEEDGALTQVVHIARFEPEIEQRMESHFAQLSPEQIGRLRDLIAETNFDAVTAAC